MIKNVKSQSMGKLKPKYLTGKKKSKIPTNFPSQINRINSSAFRIKSSNQKFCQQQLKNPTVFGSVKYKNKTLLNFANSFNENGKFDNETLETQVKILTQKNFTQNKEFLKNQKKLEKLNSQIQQDQEFFEDQKYLFQTKNTKVLQNSSNNQNENSTLKILTQKKETTENQISQTTQKIEQLMRTTQFSQSKLLKQYHKLLKEEIQNQSPQNLVEKLLAYSSQKSLGLKLDSYIPKAYLQHIQEKDFIYRKFYLNHLLLENTKTKNEEIYKELDYQCEVEESLIKTQTILKKQQEQKKNSIETISKKLNDYQKCYQKLLGKSLKETLFGLYENNREKIEFFKKKQIR